MCLSPRYGKSDEPFNKSKIRYKVVVKHPGKRLSAPYRGWGFQYAPVGKWRIAETKDKDIARAGFHVFLNKTAALQDKRSNRWDSQYLIAEVRVSGFLCSGYFDFHKSETWKRMKILRIIKFNK